MKLKNKLTKTELRRRRTRKKVKAASFRPRLHVYRSNQHTYAQIIDDQAGKTLVSATEKEIKKPKDTKLERAEQIGTLIAKKAQDKNIKKVAFDRGSYKYHGRIKAVAQAAREKGLDF